MRRCLPLALLLLAACADDPADPATTPADVPPPPVSVQNDLAAGLNSEGFTALATLADAAGLTEVLQSEGPYTVLAPTDEAFAAAAEALRDPAQRERLTAILQHHIIPGRIEIEEDLLPMGVEALDGSEITFEKAGDNVRVRDAEGRSAQIVRQGLNVSNGVIHAIDQPLTSEGTADGEVR